MFYIWNARGWLAEVMSACNERNRDPEDSVFILMLFSSLDFGYLAFFRDKKSQISQYSGQNVHLFTPMIYENDVVPDDEWRFVREGFAAAGIQIGNRPTCVLFTLRKHSDASGYEPHYFAAFECPAFERFSELLRDLADTCIARRRDPEALTRSLGLLLCSDNLARRIEASNPLSQGPVPSIFGSPRTFVSYAHGDGAVVVLEWYKFGTTRPPESTRKGYGNALRIRKLLILLWFYWCRRRESNPHALAGGGF